MERGAGLYQTILKLFANKAGLGECDFTSHSLHRGEATYLVICGVTIEEIKVRGDWASEAVYAYLKTPLWVLIMNDLRVSASLAQVSLEYCWVEPSLLGKVPLWPLFLPGQEPSAKINLGRFQGSLPLLSPVFFSKHSQFYVKSNLLYI